MIGKNGSIFTKTHEGYAMHTEGNSTLKGESSEKDLKITAITTGAKPAWLEEDVDINVRNVAIGIGDTADTQTTLNNIDVTALAPNGGVAYINNAGTRLKVEGEIYLF
ncbi:hypothetical protein A4A71_09515 [Nicoletella semolina]|uniref:hypothetical protein n=1 Tax=Nicoletella semolina TaxID=271160 RepID=UPI0024477FE9|nr:hypothetical protein [Nicoletella semolina]MDH2925537.1 hypothetical protein [Nicoletella semolina]